jgi:hypothetical protein
VYDLPYASTSLVIECLNNDRNHNGKQHVQNLHGSPNQGLKEEVDSLLPENQIGFRRGRSTIQAIGNLAQDTEAALRETEGKPYAMFIHYTKAFDLMNRRNLIRKLNECVGQDNACQNSMEWRGC